MSSVTLLLCFLFFGKGKNKTREEKIIDNGYESAFLADLVASYLLEVTNNQFKEVLWRVIYRDDGLLVFKGKKSLPEIQIWRDKFQEKIDEIAGNDYLQFTCEIWNPGGRPSRNETETTSMVTKKVFPFLDLEFFWDDSRRLEFQVHRKKNQLLKYLNKEITHKKATLKAIPNGVLNRLAKLTSRTEKNAKMTIKERYFEYANALSRAGLGMKNSPTLKELWENADEQEKKKKEKRKRKKGGG